MSLSQIIHHLNLRSTRILPKLKPIHKFLFVTLVVATSIFLTTRILAADNIIKYTQDAQVSGNNSEAWQLNSWNTTAINALTSLTGEIPFNDDGSVDTKKYQVSGLFGTSTNMIASFYNPQASGIEYIAQVKDDLIGKSAYAQGVAFRQDQSLQPLLPIWRALRNIVYVVSSIIFIVIGIMIMLRVKISPQAVVTIQSAIPRLITSLILVTFSYAIAGLIIDLSYWFQSAVIAIIFSAKGVGLDSNLFNGKWTSLNIGDLVPGQTWFNFSGLANANFVKLSMLANATVPAFSLIQLGGLVGQIVLGSIIGGATGLLGSALGGGGGLVGGAIGWVVGAIGGVIFMLILFILVAIWLIKLFFGLLKTYVTIIIQIVTAPLVIGMGAFPNSKVGFSSWFIDLVSKVAVFPVVLIALVFTNYLVEISTGNLLTNSGYLWVPSLLNAGNENAGILGAAIGIAGLAMIAKLPDLVPQAIFQLKPSPFGQAIGEGLKPASAIGKVGVGYGLQSADDTAGSSTGSRWWNKAISGTNSAWKSSQKNH